MRLRTTFQVLGTIAIVFTLLPFVAVDYWWIRMFDFPHFQLTIFTLLTILFYLFKFDFKWRNDYIFLTILFACFVFQLAKIYPYTAFAKYELLNSENPNPDKKLSLYLANVLQTNTAYEKVLSGIKTNDPDLVLLTETNTRWKAAIGPEIEKSYKYRVEYPLENTYGMLMYSRFPLVDPKVLFQVDDSIPSIHTRLVLPSNDTLQIYAIHPTPPMPQHNPASTDRDAELMKVALKARESSYPVMVIGDFNDVAWSISTNLFQKVSGLLDLRKGRGFFNTFHAKYFMMRWPLDHIFVSEEFRVIDAQRGAKINSDHFPIFTVLSLEQEGASIQKAPPPTADKLDTAKKIIQKEKEKDKKSS